MRGNLAFVCAIPIQCIVVNLIDVAKVLRNVVVEVLAIVIGSGVAAELPEGHREK